MTKTGNNHLPQNGIALFKGHQKPVHHPRILPCLHFMHQSPLLIRYCHPQLMSSTTTFTSIIVHQWDKETAYIYTHAMGHYSVLEKEAPVICDNMEETRWYCVKWNKLDRERKIVHAWTHFWNLKIKQQQKPNTGIHRNRVEKWLVGWRSAGAGKGKWRSIPK